MTDIMDEKACSNHYDCPCTRECENHGRCCDCISSHLARCSEFPLDEESVPYCYRVLGYSEIYKVEEE